MNPVAGLPFRASAATPPFPSRCRAAPQLPRSVSRLPPRASASTAGSAVALPCPTWSSALGLYERERLGLSRYADEESKEDIFWETLDADLQYWTRSLRPVQWYPGHIAKTEKELKGQLKLMDVVIEVRDARIPLATTHPKMDSWLGNRRRIIVMNREDMVSAEDRNAWATYFSSQGIKVMYSNGQLGMGTMKLGRMAKSVASTVNTKRREKGLLPRPVRAGIVGYPNVGKSSLINRLLKRRMCPAAPRPGVTRELKWVRFGKDLELLDSPGILPMRISDQTAALKLAICDDIGERSYDFDDVAAILVQLLLRHPAVGEWSNILMISILCFYRRAGFELQNQAFSIYSLRHLLCIGRSSILS
ncbi:DAR GTPase 3, chloroplastic isoform X2 [Brachypodium distachyon]|uniref:DAR GTPase 3, chloroplastic isoform X2 n=1 Tax=Brachypodium distachyon TaxID=15368 RepID=UPI000D0E270A|nr:DAR GTPase 3, chloroplastic isoform X2 [Brachypodium distachyon]|eukprot:XP_024314938.1 DAR GTPase 3, chloroplastic isoform X2 [Brachypodium distachyon]